MVKIFFRKYLFDFELFDIFQGKIKEFFVSKGISQEKNKTIFS